MITISNGLKNSLIVLEFLRNNEDLKNYTIHVGTFTNCREVGLTFIITGLYKDGDYKVVDNFTFCVYEHRNSDEIIVNGKEGYVCLNGELPYGGETKWDYIKSFSYNKHMEAADYLASSIIEHAEKSYTKREDEKAATTKG
jgi:hypothetical protein